MSKKFPRSKRMMVVVPETNVISERWLSPLSTENLTEGLANFSCGMLCCAKSLTQTGGDTKMEGKQFGLLLGSRVLCVVTGIHSQDHLLDVVWKTQRPGAEVVEGPHIAHRLPHHRESLSRGGHSSNLTPRGWAGGRGHGEPFAEDFGEKRRHEEEVEC